MGNSNSGEDNNNQAQQQQNKPQRITINDSTELREVQAQKNHLDELTYLDIFLSASCIDNEGALIIAEILNEAPKVAELRIALANHRITEDGFKAIFNSFSKLTAVKKLTLELGQFDENFYIGDINFQHLCSGLQSLSGSLQDIKLWLATNNISNEGSKHLSSALSSLTQLNIVFINLMGNKIENDQGQAIADSIASLSQLKTLTLLLQYNEIQRETRDKMTAIFDGLKNNKGVELKEIEL